MKRQFLILKQLDRQLEPFKRLNMLKPKDGWVRQIRKAIGMTTKQLAHRLGVHRSRIIKIEQSEPEGAITLKTLEEVAQTLNCELVYAFIPKVTFQQMIEDRARKIAQNRLKHVAHSMLLEKQSVHIKVQQEQLEEMVKEMLNGSFKSLWNDDEI